jgi:hypothetical protein
LLSQATDIAIDVGFDKCYYGNNPYNDAINATKHTLVATTLVSNGTFSLYIYPKTYVW